VGEIGLIADLLHFAGIVLGAADEVPMRQGGHRVRSACTVGLNLELRLD
jgi:hypothetical protein